ncbi:RPA-interacting protein B-like isoform X2 [Liolophura sinensis]|uniref:RPA-interacting protein B-like isoform X2 n=1 Tax=Liolophura sinensis TaxID=3198878 RepID=UPI0031598171
MDGSVKRSPAVSRHKQMYKSSTPPWKETYRKRCLEKLKSSRQKLQDRFRNIPHQSNKSFIKSLMKEEWHALKGDKEDLPRLADQAEEFRFDDDLNNIDSVLAIFEEIQADLMREEQRLLEEFDQSLQFDEALLCASIECLQTDELICPVCQRYPLMQNLSVIFCKCGVRIDTEDCLSLSQVRQQLEEGMAAHNNSHCDQDPRFTVVGAAGIQNLLMTCQGCDFMFVVI